MVRLVEKKPCAGLLPVEAGALRLEHLPVPAIAWIAPAPGREAAVTQALKQVVGAGFPAPGRATGKAGTRCVWFAHGQALLLAAAVPALADAAVVDQSHGWAVLRLSGAGCEDVLARLVALDLRPERFRRGHAARTMARHVPLIVIRAGQGAFELVVPSSMVKTAIDDLARAMRIVAARAPARAPG